MGEHMHREQSAEEGASSEHESSSPNGVGLVEDLIRAAVLGLALGSVLFVVSDQTGLIDRVLSWLSLPGIGEDLGPKLLVIAGILFGVTLDLLAKLLRRSRRFLVERFP